MLVLPGWLGVVVLRWYSKSVFCTMCCDDTEGLGVLPELQSKPLRTTAGEVVVILFKGGWDTM